MNSTAQFQGKHVLVTGAASGIGRAAAEYFAAQGAAVLGLDRNAPERDPGFPVLLGDVTDDESIERAVGQAAGQKQLDICVANAGVIRFEPWLNSSVDSWRQTFDVNLMGTLRTLQAAARRMIADGNPGRLLVTSSVGGLRSDPGFSAYCASKAAVISLVEAAALALASHGITVNAVAPGEIKTKMHDDVMTVLGSATGRTSDACRAEAVASVPLGRMGSAADVAEVFGFLASDAAGYLTGLTMRIDGGQLLH